MTAAPAPQPFDPTAPGGGILYASSTGVGPVSGVSGTGWYDGPWTIIQQWLTITYHRVPSVTVSGYNLDLDSASQSYQNDSTNIACVFDAVVTHTSSTDNYPLEEYQQPHTFEILAVSSDHLGNSYGALNGSCMGPMGTIATKMPFYHRRPQTQHESATADSFYGTSSVRASNFQYGTRTMETSSPGGDQTQGMTDFKAWHRPHKVGSFSNPNWDGLAKYSTSISPYHLGGAYSVGQENMLPIWTFITSVGFNISQEMCEAVPSLRSEFFGGAYNEPWLLVGNGYYDSNRHDFS